MGYFRKGCFFSGCGLVLLTLVNAYFAKGAVQAFFTHSGASSVQREALVPAKAIVNTVPLAAQSLRFEKNEGQWSKTTQFSARGKGYQVDIAAQETILTLASKSLAKKHSPVLRLQLRQSQPAPVIEGVDPLVGRTNYFLGRTSSQWHTDIPNYEKVRVREVYPGIDMLYYGTPEHLEYDFEVAPGADPRRIELALQGAGRWRLTKEGDLVVNLGTAEFRQKKPVAYQLINGSRQEVEVRYRLTRRNTVQFQLGRYDETQTLVIDPVLVYSTLFGGRYLDGATLIRTDAAGNLYVLGDTQSDDFPVVNPAQARKSELPTPLCSGNGCTDIFISKFDPTGRQLLFSTYLGGTYIENALGLEVDINGNVYVTGVTWSRDFPTTPGCFQAERKGWSTVGRDVFVAKLNPMGSVLLYSTYLGGSGNEESFNLTVDNAENAYVVGWTESNDFPTHNPLRAYHEDNGGVDGFVSKLNPWGTELLFSTYLGGSEEDFCNDVKVDQEGNVYVTGSTVSADFPTTSGAYQTEWGGRNDAFVCKLRPDGAGLLFATFVGGDGNDVATSLVLDAQKNIYAVGYSSSYDGSFTFPLVNPMQRESPLYPLLAPATDVMGVNSP